MEQNNIFELFGITQEELERSSKKRQASGQTKEKKRDGDKKEKKTSGNVYPLPLNVYGCGYCMQVSIDDKKQITHGELIKLLAGQYDGLGAFKFSVKKMEGTNDVVLIQFLNEAESDVEGEAKICYGDTELYFRGGTIAEAKAVWCGEHPEFSGCQMAYNKEKHVLVPFFKENGTAGKTYRTPIQIGIMQHVVHIQEEMDSVALEILKDAYLKEYPYYKECPFFYSEEGHILIPVLQGTKGKVERVSLPIKVRMALSEIEYGSEDFEGRTEATLEEIRNKLEQIYPEFSKERTEMEYDKRHFIIPILRGSTKGVTIHSRSNNYGLYIVEGCDGKLYRIEKTPVGQFAVCLSDPKEQPEFYFTLPKIPRKILDEVMSFFIHFRDHEVACQLFYRLGEGYTLHYPQQKYTISQVTFLRDARLENEKTLVMDMHSHGALAAQFSMQDDRDEKGTRLYLVAGNLYRHPEINIRAGIIGRFKKVYLEDIFE